jgi:ABC-type transport system substrate-binding protein
VILLISTGVSAGPIEIAAFSSHENYVGPYLDRIHYSIITQDDQAVLALQDDDIDLIGDMVDPSFLPALEASIGISTQVTRRNGYGYLHINCERYPMNITGFRRALAYALDKFEISTVTWDGLAEPQDSVVPKQSPWSVESELDSRYYYANVSIGNDILDAAGFVDSDHDDFREAPDGSELNVSVFASISSNLAMEVASATVDALAALSIHGYVETDFYWYPTLPEDNPINNGDFDIVFRGETFSNWDVDWLAYEYWSEYADEVWWNIPRFRNATFDSYRQQLLHSVDHDEVFEASRQMQLILAHECPTIICYNNHQVSAYRTNRFEGHVNDVGDGVPCWWTNYKVSLQLQLGGPFGGIFRWSTPLDIDTFNFMSSSSAYAWSIFQMLYESLFRTDSAGNTIPWLVESYSLETKDDYEFVPVNHTRLTLNLYENITWSDGTPFSAEDVKFTFEFYQNATDNPYSVGLEEIDNIVVMTPRTLYIDMLSESYWHLTNIGFRPILPKHIFENINPENWELWDPDPRVHSIVTLGPFNISTYVPGEFIELSHNPSYFRSPEPLETTVIVDTIPTLHGPTDVLAILLRAVPVVIVTIVIVLIVWKFRRI